MEKENFDIDKFAQLGNLNLSEEEILLFTRQFSDILGFVKQLGEVDTAKVEPIAQIAGLENIMREDRIIGGLKMESVLQNAKETQGNFIKVEKVLKNEDN